MKLNKKITIGFSIWFPIWIYSYTDHAEKYVDWNVFGITLLVIMVIGIIVMYWGINQSD